MNRAQQVDFEDVGVLETLRNELLAVEGQPTNSVYQSSKEHSFLSLPASLCANRFATLVAVDLTVKSGGQAGPRLTKRRRPLIQPMRDLELKNAQKRPAQPILGKR